MKVKINKKNKKKTKKFNKKKILFLILGIILTLIIVAVIIFALSYGSAKNLYEEAMLGKNNFLQAQQTLQEQNFAETATNFSEAQEHFTSASTSLDKISWTKHLPWIGRQVKAVDHLLNAGINIADGLEELSLLGEEIISIVKVEGEETSFNKIGKKKKRKVLKKLYESPEVISESTEKLEIAVADIEAIPEKGLVKPLREGIEPIKDNLPLVEEFIDKAAPFVEVLPAVAGYPEETTYLFLLQNNTELRPAGGFIGTYGILKLEAANINQFETDNIYNLDGPAEQFLFIPPLEPYQKYVDAKGWYMRDSNWWPDFPTSAKKAEEFYHLENGAEQDIDGIIAVTPTFIESLIELTGPIEVKGEVYNKENFIDKLQHKVLFGFVQEGLSDSERKDVIGDMAGILIDRLENLPKEQWVDLWQIVSQNAEQKQILLHLKDEEAQKYLEELEWDGRVKDSDYTGRDFAMVIDANMAALKTDKVMERNLDYTIAEEGEDLIGTLKVTYKNNGTFTNTTTRYRSYTRVYVPRGSELISSEGFTTNDKLKGGVPTTALVKQDEEFNKTIFEGFIAIEPQAQEELVLKYKLPQEIKDLVSKDEYKLYVQKQAGTIAHGLTINFDIGQKIKQVLAIDLNTEIDNNKVRFTGDLRKDKSIEILLK